MKNDIFLTSKLDLYTKDSSGRKVAHSISNYNGLIENFKTSIKGYKNFLYIASTEENYFLNDEYANVTFKSFDMTLPFENYYILDGRTLNKINELIIKADFIFISGGNVDSQNNFFQKCNLRKAIEKTSAVICCVSAGTMNSAEKVYCPPENEIELNDKKFQKSYIGLGLTKINVLPHFDVLFKTTICEKKYIEDIIYPDSYDKEIFALTDKSYIQIKSNNKIIYHGEIYLIKSGKLQLLTKIKAKEGNYE